MTSNESPVRGKNMLEVDSETLFPWKSVRRKSCERSTQRWAITRRTAQLGASNLFDGVSHHMLRTYNFAVRKQLEVCFLID